MTVTGERLGPATITLVGLMARVAGWRPDEVWAATPADVRAVLAGWTEGDGETGFDRAALSAMMEQYPDG